MVITAWYWLKTAMQHEDIETLGIISHLIFDKGAKTIGWMKNKSPTSGAGKTGYTHAEDGI